MPCHLVEGKFDHCNSLFHDGSTGGNRYSSGFNDNANSGNAGAICMILKTKSFSINACIISSISYLMSVKRLSSEAQLRLKPTS